MNSLINIEIYRKKKCCSFNEYATVNANQVYISFFVYKYTYKYIKPQGGKKYCNKT